MEPQSKRGTAPPHHHNRRRRQQHPQLTHARLTTSRLPAENKIEQQEISLKDELIILEDGTKARNREFYRQLDAISERGRNWEQKLAQEIKAQRKAQKELASFFETTLTETVQAERRAVGWNHSK